MNGMVSSVMSREEFFGKQGEEFVEEAFRGSLPAFIAAFTTGKQGFPARDAPWEPCGRFFQSLNIWVQNKREPAAPKFTLERYKNREYRPERFSAASECGRMVSVYLRSVMSARKTGSLRADGRAG